MSLLDLFYIRQKKSQAIFTRNITDISVKMSRQRQNRVYYRDDTHQPEQLSQVIHRRRPLNEPDKPNEAEFYVTFNSYSRELFARSNSEKCIM